MFTSWSHGISTLISKLSYLSNLGLIRAALRNLKTKGYSRVYDFRDRNEFFESSEFRDPIMK